MIRLAIETSTMVQSIALEIDGQCVDSVRIACKRGHGPLLAGTVSDALKRHGLKPNELGALVVGIGPGSFTGLRIGLAFAKGLAALKELACLVAPLSRCCIRRHHCA